LSDQPEPIVVGPAALRSILTVRATRDLFFGHLARHGVDPEQWKQRVIASGGATEEDFEEPDLWGFR
jgi:hypothetical protein